MNSVEKWLKGSRNFFVGKTIYKTIGGDVHLKKLLDMGKTAHAEELLYKGIKALLLKPSKEVIKTPASVVEAGEMSDDADLILKSIREEWLVPYQKMNYLRHQLDQYTGDGADAVNRRKNIAFEILDLEQQCMKCWDKRDYYMLNKKLPDVVENTLILPDNAVDLAKMLENIKRNIRRNKIFMQSHPDKPAFAQRYFEYKKNYAEVTGKEYEETN